MLNILNQATGLKFELPTEWQWEYACRCGSDTLVDGGTTWRKYEQGNTTDRNCTEETGVNYVDRYPPNAWGFYDMLGNCWEWCVNIYWTTDIVKDGVYTDPEGHSNLGADNKQRALKGGSLTDQRVDTVRAYHQNRIDEGTCTYDTHKFIAARFCLTIE